MISVLRGIGIVLVGVVMAVVVIVAIDFLVFTIYPLPGGARMSDPASLRAAVPLTPVAALVGVQIAWFVGTLAGCWLATRLARQAPILHGMSVGLAVLIAGIADVAAIPNPPHWFPITGVAAYLAGSIAGTMLAGSGSDRSA